MKAVGVLVRCPPGRPPPPPDAMPVGRAALLAEAEGIPVVVGDEVSGGVMSGLRAVGGAWVRTEAELVACYDRFPSQTWPKRFAHSVAELGVPLGNPPALTALCRDKVACQRHLEAAGIAQPPLLEALTEAAFLKPRHGSFGQGVRRVVPGDVELPVAGLSSGDWLLQRAVPPPDGWAAVSVRLLAQRDLDGWHLAQPVARRDRTDPVANVARTAEVVPHPLDAPLRSLALEVCAALETPHLVELGLDFAIDVDGRPWLIEVNGRPRGRLEVAAERWPRLFAEAHRNALVRPIRTLYRTNGF